MRSSNHLIKHKNGRCPTGISHFGAATQIRTGDLILTKDVLYQLSHSSNCERYYIKKDLLCQDVFRIFLKKREIFFLLLKILDMARILAYHYNE